MRARFIAWLIAICPTAVLAQDPPPGLRVESLPEHLAYLDQVASPQSPVQQQLYAQARRWTPGDTLKVCFFGGDAVSRTLITTVAREWEAHGNIRFDFGQPGVYRDCLNSSQGFSQIRIGFGERGDWSAVGRDSVTRLNQYQPSMNLGGYDLKYSSFQVSSSGQPYTPVNVVSLSAVRDRGTILHEFGHALSLLHEHQNPALGCEAEIRWEGPTGVYALYEKWHGWPRHKTERNLGPIKLADPDYVSGEPDRESVMIYAQPEQIFYRGRQSVCFVEEKNSVSAKDKQLVGRLYPAGVAPGSDLAFSLEPPAGAVMVLPPSGPGIQADRLTRITADLESPVTSVRREARRELALELKANDDPVLIASLLDQAARASYRQKLGVLVAIDKAQPSAQAQGAAAQTVRRSLQQIGATGDATLRTYTDKARSTLGSPQ